MNCVYSNLVLVNNNEHNVYLFENLAHIRQPADIAFFFFFEGHFRLTEE